MSCFQGLNPNKLLLSPKADCVLQKESAPQLHHFSILSHNKVSLALYEFPLQWYFSSLDYATAPLLSHNSVLNNIVKRTTHKPKCFRCYYRNNKKKNTQRAHIPIGRLMRVLIRLKFLFLGTKRVPIHHKDSQTYNLSFSKDTRLYV